MMNHDFIDLYLPRRIVFHFHGLAIRVNQLVPQMMDLLTRSKAPETKLTDIYTLPLNENLDYK